METLLVEKQNTEECLLQNVLCILYDLFPESLAVFAYLVKVFVSDFTPVLNLTILSHVSMIGNGNTDRLMSHAIYI